MMTPESVFSITNGIAFGAWALLVVVPRWAWTERLVLSGLVPLLLALVYWVCLGSVIAQGAPEGAGFDSLEAVSLLFADRWGLLAGWVHYLCFDLLVGIAVHKELGEKRTLVRIPCLCLTFVLGPVGWSLSRLALMKSAPGASSMPSERKTG